MDRLLRLGGAGMGMGQNSAPTDAPVVGKFVANKKNFVVPSKLWKITQNNDSLFSILMQILPNKSTFLLLLY